MDIGWGGDEVGSRRPGDETSGGPTGDGIQPPPEAEPDPPGPDSRGVEPAAARATDGDPRGRLAGVIALYTVERLGLTALLAFGLSTFMPLLVALAFAVVLQMPLAFVLFRGTRERLSRALAVANERRRTDRDRLRAALAGDGEVDPDRESPDR